MVSKSTRYRYRIFRRYRYLEIDPIPDTSSTRYRFRPITTEYPPPFKVRIPPPPHMKKRPKYMQLIRRKIISHIEKSPPPPYKKKISTGGRARAYYCPSICQHPYKIFVHYIGAPQQLKRTLYSDYYIRILYQ